MTQQTRAFASVSLLALIVGWMLLCRPLAAQSLIKFPPTVSQTPEAAPPATAPPATNPPANIPPATNPPATTPTTPPATPTTAEVPTVADIEALIKQVEANPNLDAEVKRKTLQNYQEALTVLKGNEQSVLRRLAWQEKTTSLPQTKEQLEDALAASPPNGAELRTMKVEELEAKLKAAEAQLEQAKLKWTAIESKPLQVKTRSDELLKLQQATKTKLETVTTELKTPPPPDEPAELTRSRRTLLQARKKAAEDELAEFTEEAKSLSASEKILPLERDVAALELSRAEATVKELNEVLSVRKLNEAEVETFWVRKDLESLQRMKPVPQNLVDIAKRNLELAQYRSGQITNGLGDKSLPELVASTAEKLSEVETKQRNLETMFQSVEEKTKALGSNDVIGELLRNQRAELPHIGQLQANIAARQELLAKIEFRRIDYQHERALLSNPEERLQQELNALRQAHGPDVAETLEPRLKRLLDKQRDQLDKLIAEYKDYHDKLVKLSVAEEQLSHVAQNYSNFIAEHILWIRSISALGLQDFSQIGAAFRWFFSVTNSLLLLHVLRDDVAAHPVLYALAAFALLAMLILQQRMRKRLSELGDQAARSSASSMMPTFRALLLTLLISSVWPAVILFIGWRISPSSLDNDAARAVSAGLMAVSIIFLTSNLFRQICRRRGLAESHFGWGREALDSVRWWMSWLLLVGLPPTYVVAVIHVQTIDRRYDTLGRLVFVVGMVTLSVMARSMLQSIDAVLLSANVGNADTRRGWIRYFWLPLLVIGPLLLSVAALAGFYYTALQLVWRLLMTFWLILAILVVQALLLRWLLIARRRLALENARKLRAGLAAKAPGQPVVPADTGAIDLATANLQTRRLIHAVLYTVGLFIAVFIWAEVLPALGVLRHFHLWTIDNYEVTLSHLLWALVVILVMSAAARNIPGVLEIALLNHLPIDTGGRYAVTTMCRYIITIIGILTTANIIGLSWSQVQWLAAAMTVGIGIGLQDIFANFFSGLIILFERPIRVGDIVTIGNTSGVVNRVRMRATTITDWDGKELILPNKDIVTGAVVNWTLSNTRLRSCIPVGIAYGSDTKLATQLLLQIALDHPTVLRDPPPQALFLGFGASSLDFELRIFVPEPGVNLPTQHAIRESIAAAFKEHHIEIAFPQTDLHIRTIDPAAAALLSRSSPSVKNGQTASN